MLKLTSAAKDICIKYSISYLDPDASNSDLPQTVTPKQNIPLVLPQKSSIGNISNSQLPSMVNNSSTTNKVPLLPGFSNTSQNLHSFPGMSNNNQIKPPSAIQLPSANKISIQLPTANLVSKSEYAPSLTDVSRADDPDDEYEEDEDEEGDDDE